MRKIDLTAEYPTESSADFIELCEDTERHLDISSRKYLSDIGLKEEDLFFLGDAQNDSRYQLFKEQREKYGFDERETWNLDTAFLVWLYERLMMYNEVNVINTDFHKIEHKGEECTFQECIDIMLAKTKDRLLGNDDDSNDIVELFAKCFNLLWW